MSPYYDQDGVTIYHGDCREVLPQLGAVPLVLTDPPYGVDKASWDGAFPLEWFHHAATQADVIGVMPGVANLLTLPRAAGLVQYRWALSVRIANGMTRGAMGFGNWIPCLVYSRDGVKLNTKAQDATQVVIRDDMPPHPSPKPYAAMAWLLARLPGELVVDPFMGSGTTLEAAKVAGRRAIGIEINEAYCEVAANRLRQGVLFGGAA